QTSYDLWIYSYETARDRSRFRRQEYVFHQMSGAHTDLPTFLISMHVVDTVEDLRAYIRRIDGIGRAMRQALQRAQDNAAFGVRAPRFSYESVIGESGKLISGKPFDAEAADDAPLFSDAKSKLAALQEQGLVTDEQATELEAAIEAALLE